MHYGLSQFSTLHCIYNLATLFLRYTKGHSDANVILFRSIADSYLDLDTTGILINYKIRNRLHKIRRQSLPITEIINRFRCGCRVSMKHLCSSYTFASSNRANSLKMHKEIENKICKTMPGEKVPVNSESIPGKEMKRRV